MNKELSFNFCFSIENSFWHVLRKWYFRNLCRTLWCVLKDQLIDMKIIRQSTTSDFLCFKRFSSELLQRIFESIYLFLMKKHPSLHTHCIDDFPLKQMRRFCFRMWHILLMMKDVYKLSNWACSSENIFCTLTTVSWSVV